MKEMCGESNTYDIGWTTNKTCKTKAVNGTAVEKIIPESKPIVFFPGQIYVLLKPDSQGTRIIGKGILE